MMDAARLAAQLLGGPAKLYRPLAPSLQEAPSVSDGLLPVVLVGALRTRRLKGGLDLGEWSRRRHRYWW
jgi:hypothetical protein